MLQLLVEAGKHQAPGASDSYAGTPNHEGMTGARPQDQSAMQSGVTWALPACECCQLVPVLLVSLLLVMNVGVSTCI